MHHWNLGKYKMIINALFLLSYLATTQVEAKLCNVEEGGLAFDVYLYVTIKGEKVIQLSYKSIGIEWFKTDVPFAEDGWQWFPPLFQ